MYNTHDPKVLPIRNGVRPSCVVLPSRGQGLILDFLCERLPLVSREDWLCRMRAGEVVDEYGSGITPLSVFNPGVRIYYYRQLFHEKEVPFVEDVIYQDEHLVVADKPHFMPVNPGGGYLQNSLLVRLRNRLALEELSPLHRIDRDTAGIVIFSVKRSERGKYQALFAKKEVCKIYEACGRLNPQVRFPLHYASRLESLEGSIRMQEVAGEPNAITDIVQLERLGDVARYQLFPITGKRHQLRVQMASLGMALCHDLLYPDNRGDAAIDYQKPLQLLAKSIKFVDPVTGEERFFESRRNLLSLSLLM